MVCTYRSKKNTISQIIITYFSLRISEKEKYCHNHFPTQTFIYQDNRKSLLNNGNLKIHSL